MLAREGCAGSPGPDHSSRPTEARGRGPQKAAPSPAERPPALCASPGEPSRGERGSGTARSSATPAPYRVRRLFISNYSSQS